MRMKIRNRSLSKALSFLCILSLILSLIPPVSIWQNVKADTTVYNGYFGSYGGQNRDYWARQAGVLPSVTISDGRTFYFNCEIYAERGQVVYGTPADVEQNSLVLPAGFKPDPNGYFYAGKQANGSYTLATPGTPGAVRGWFRYLGYKVLGAPF